MFYIMKYTNLKKIGLNHVQEDVSSSFFSYDLQMSSYFYFKSSKFQQKTIFAVAKVSKTIVDFAALRFRDNFIYETDKKSCNKDIYLYVQKMQYMQQSNRCVVNMNGFVIPVALTLIHVSLDL